MTEIRATNPTAAVLIIGNEILSGKTQDINLNAIALRLLPLGIKLTEARVVADEETAIIAAVNALRAVYDYVFTTGGIGPTHDDITAAAVAKAFGRAVVENPEARARLFGYYGAEKLTPARLRMALMPEAAILINNPVSVAPGFQVENVFVLAGVPDIMRAMFEDCVARLQAGPAYQSRTINCLVAESLVAEPLRAIADEFSDCSIGSYPWFRLGQYGLSIVVRGTDSARLDAAAAAILALTRQHDSSAMLAVSVHSSGGV